MLSRAPRHVLTFAAIVTLAVGLAACSAAGPQYKSVRLSNGDAAGTAATPAASGNPIRVAVASVVSPKGTLESYSGLIAYLGQRLGRPIELLQRQTYAETNDLVKRGAVELAFVCSGAYVRGEQDAAMELLVVPQVDGKTTYHSYVIVPYGSAISTFEGLRGKVFAFTDPLSNTGYLATVYRLNQMGLRPEFFFQKSIYTYSHDNSIKAVAEGLVDGASVDSLVYDFAVARDPSLAKRVRIVARSDPFGIPPVVVPKALDEELKTRMRQILLGMHEEEQGAVILQGLMIDRYVPPADSAYDSIRAMIEAVGR